MISKPWLPDGQLKSEILREALEIALDGLVERSSLDADEANTSLEECLDLIFQLLPRYQLDLALVYLLSTALRLNQPQLPSFSFGQLIQALKKLLRQVRSILQRQVQHGLFEISGVGAHKKV